MKKISLATALAIALSVSQAHEIGPFDDPVSAFQEISESTDRPCSRRSFFLPIAASMQELAYAKPSAKRIVVYRMDLNQVTEGWNWHPESALVGADYYRAKFLPLGSVSEERGSYQGEDKVGESQVFTVEWRYDYFATFENHNEFFVQHTADDDSGFSAAVDATVPIERIALAARITLNEPCTAQSTTFWKATHARPVDFTLKKRYLNGVLETVVFYDRHSGRVLANNYKMPENSRIVAE
jgi:hypothetical protein